MKSRPPAARVCGMPATPATVYLGLGANQGRRTHNLRHGLAGLALHPEIALEAVSNVYETQFVGEGSQDPYLNACAAIRTHLPPRVLLSVLQSIELRCGRKPDGHMLPRPLDLDILLYEDRVQLDADLVLPHPRLRERAFALVPLAEIAPGVQFPDSYETVAEVCAKIRRKDGPWLRLRDDIQLIPQTANGHKEDWRAALAVHSR